MDILKKHREFFPSNEIPSLYSYQNEVLRKLLGKNNTLAIIPTGGGKSLIYQLAALELPGSTIIVSPLLALMSEQVRYLDEKGIRVLTINSYSSFTEQREIYRTLADIKPKIIYVSPERLQSYYFMAALRHNNIKISMVAIDEAHCISQWGIDFRPEYSQINSFLNFLKSYGQVPILFALTATLSKEPRHDIISEFKIKKSSVVVNEDVIRDNLNLHYQRVDKEEDKLHYLTRFIKKNRCKKVLVYLYNKSQCEELADSDELDNYVCDYFHADLSPDMKKAVYDAFRDGDINILFSTTAFGMGMNVPDIDAIIHYHLPGSVEEYYQHVGRGARNKLSCPVANCLALWSEENFKVKKRRILKGRLTTDKLEKAIDLLDARDKKGELSSIDYQNYKVVNVVNLTLVKFLFEKYGVIKTMGEVHGTPREIKLTNESIFWNGIIDKMGYANSYIAASKKAGVPIDKIVEFIYSEDLNGNLSYLPAFGKKIIFKCNYNELPKHICRGIITEDEENIEFKLIQLSQLKKLYHISDSLKIKKYIAKVLDVKLSAT